MVPPYRTSWVLGLSNPTHTQLQLAWTQNTHTHPPNRKYDLDQQKIRKCCVPLNMSFLKIAKGQQPPGIYDKNLGKWWGFQLPFPQLLIAGCTPRYHSLWHQVFPLRHLTQWDSPTPGRIFDDGGQRNDPWSNWYNGNHKIILYIKMNILCKYVLLNNNIINMIFHVACIYTWTVCIWCICKTWKYI